MLRSDPLNATPLVSSAFQPSRECSIPGLHSDWHLQLIEGVLHDIVRIPIINALHDNIHVRCQGIREKEKLSARQGLKARQAEKLGFKILDARDR